MIFINRASSIVKALFMGGLALGVMHGAAWAESYECIIKPNKAEQSIFPTTLHIEWPNYLKPPMVSAPLFQKAQSRSIAATVPVDNAKRLTLAWNIKNLPIANLRQLVGGTGSYSSISYRASILSGSGKLVLSANVIVNDGYSVYTDFRAEGRCKVVK